MSLPGQHDSALGLVVDAYSVVARQWRRLFAAAVPILATAQLLSVAIPAVVSGGRGAIVNGRLEASETALRWTTASLRIEAFDGVVVRLAVPVVLLLGWVVALATCLLVAANVRIGEPLRARLAWPVLRRAVALAVMILVGSTLLFVLALWAATSIGGALGVVVLVLLVAAIAVGLTRLAIAIPFVLVQRSSLADAVTRAWAVTQTRSLFLSVTLTIGMAIVPALALWAASAVGDALTDAWATGATSSAVAAGIGTVLISLALCVVVPPQAAVLLRAYRWVCEAGAAQGNDLDGNDTASAAAEPAPGASRRRLAELVLVALTPALLATGYALTNPHGLPVISIGERQSWGIRNPAATGVLAGGASVIVEEIGIVVCSDLLCDDGLSVGLPCIDGGPLRPVSGDGMGCSIEAPIDDAVLRPDGTVVALRRGSDHDLRLYWCRLTGTQRCEWGGATTLHQAIEHSSGAHPATSLALASTPDGGVVAAFMMPGTGSRAEIMLVSCPDLPCAQPKLRTVGEVPVPESFGDGPLALAVNQVSGSMAIGYHDRHTGDLWLGGCPTVDCADLSLRPVGQWHTAGDDNPYQHLRLAAARTGPVAIPPRGEGTVVVCDDTACDAHHTLTVKAPPGGATLTTDQDGTTYIVAAGPTAGTLPTLRLTAVAGQGPHMPDPILVPIQDAQRVLSVIFDSDDRPRVLLSTLGGLVVVTLE